MILIRNLTKYVLKQPLFEELSLTVQPGDKIGIVGPNGGGKTTLLKIIAGIENADQGTVDTQSERVGYLPQDPEFEEYDSIEFFLAVPSHKMEKVLSQVSMDYLDTRTPLSQLSGGQKTRVGLAKVLLSNPSVLLLDEPTNHLDSVALQWLQNFINAFQGAVLIVSHDRALINQTVHRIVEIDSINKEVNEFAGNYDAYIEQKQKLVEKQEEAYSQQERKRKKMEDWIRHRQDIASNSPNPAMGKQIQMMKRRLQREVVDQEIDRPKDYKALSKASLSGEVPSGKLVLRVKDLTKQLSNKQVLHGVNFEIRGSERVQIIGENGSGKTTLLKIITGEWEADSGTVTVGPNINIGYFAQEHDSLDPNRTVQEEFLATERLEIGSKNPRSVLGNFLFKNDEVFKRVRELSLGQRVRLVFAKLMSQQNELLVLDEPTNHLDIASRESIEKALRNYEGAILVISHDLYFLKEIGITTKLLLKGGTLVRKQ